MGRRRVGKTRLDDGQPAGPRGPSPCSNERRSTLQPRIARAEADRSEGRTSGAVRRRSDQAEVPHRQHIDCGRAKPDLSPRQNAIRRGLKGRGVIARACRARRCNVTASVEEAEVQPSPRLPPNRHPVDQRDVDDEYQATLPNHCEKRRHTSRGLSNLDIAAKSRCVQSRRQVLKQRLHALLHCIREARERHVPANCGRSTGERNGVAHGTPEEATVRRARGKLDSPLFDPARRFNAESGLPSSAFLQITTAASVLSCIEARKANRASNRSGQGANRRRTGRYGEDLQRRPGLFEADLPQLYAGQHTSKPLQRPLHAGAPGTCLSSLAHHFRQLRLLRMPRRRSIPGRCRTARSSTRAECRSSSRWPRSARPSRTPTPDYRT